VLFRSEGCWGGQPWLALPPCQLSARASSCCCGLHCHACGCSCTRALAGCLLPATATAAAGRAAVPPPPSFRPFHTTAASCLLRPGSPLQHHAPLAGDVQIDNLALQQSPQGRQQAGQQPHVCSVLLQRRPLPPHPSEPPPPPLLPPPGWRPPGGASSPTPLPIGSPAAPKAGSHRPVMPHDGLPPAGPLPPLPPRPNDPPPAPAPPVLPRRAEWRTSGSFGFATLAGGGGGAARPGSGAVKQRLGNA